MRSMFVVVCFVWWLLTVVVGCHALVAWLEAVVMLAVAGLQSFSSRQTRVL